jgi:dTDP-4-dehydrorhamnose 3,5-epimerase
VKFEPQSIAGMFCILPEVHQDERGVLRRSFCQEELRDVGIEFDVRQGNISENLHAHTLRGFHYQEAPASEAKILTCISGELYNVVLDIRDGSATFGTWVPTRISATGRQSVYVPAGCANAFLTMSDNTVVHYYMSEFFTPETYRGFRYDDPAFGIEWPCEPAVISDKDANYLAFQRP